MATSEDARTPVRMLTLTDPEFYEVEIKVLEDLVTSHGQQTIADVCRGRNIDQYDFKDRWSSVLRRLDPAGLLEKLSVIKGLLGTPIYDISRQLNLSVGLVRNIVKKLLVKPESTHQRTKINMAHRMMDSCGGSLKKAKARLSKKPRKNSNVRKDNSEDELLDSSSSDSDEESEDESREMQPRKKAKVSDEKPKTESLPYKSEAPPTHPLVKLESWFPTTITMVDDIDPVLTVEFQDVISPKLQIQTLSQLTDSLDLQQACEKTGVDFVTMRKYWNSIISYFSFYQLDAYLMAVVTLHRLGYGCAVIAEAVNLPKSVVAATLSNLKMDLGATYGRSFDVTVFLVKKEVMTSSRLSEVCGVPREVGRQLIKRCTSKEQFLNKLKTALGDGSTPNKIMWLYERGLSPQVISTVLKVPETLVCAILPEDVNA